MACREDTSQITFQMKYNEQLQQQRLEASVNASNVQAQSKAQEDLFRGTTTTTAPRTPAPSTSNIPTQQQYRYRQ